MRTPLSTYDRRRLLRLGAMIGFVPALGGLSRPPAFDGAMGWAASTPGGRGGRILRVTSLSSDGPGSLRAALSEPGPRIVVFEVGGVIDLGRRDLELTEPFVTLAGQTAPEPGITVIRGGLHIRTHDVVVRHLRFRPGADGAPPRSGWNVDGLTCVAARNVIVDQCSFSWATDENLSASGPRFEGGERPEQWRQHTSRRITFSRNIVAEGLSNSSHTKGEHSKGTLIHDNVTEVFIAGNLYAHNHERNPLFKGGAQATAANNLIYDPGNKAMNYAQLAKEWGDRPRVAGRLGVVGNVVRGGASTRADLAFLTLQGDGALGLHMSDNLARHADGREMAMIGHDPGETTQVAALDLSAVCPAAFSPLPASEVEAWVMQEAGARPWARDAVDARILTQVRNGSGRIIDDEAAVGGYPGPAMTRRPFTPSEWNLADLTRRDGRPS